MKIDRLVVAWALACWALPACTSNDPGTQTAGAGSGGGGATGSAGAGAGGMAVGGSAGDVSGGAGMGGEGGAAGATAGAGAGGAAGAENMDPMLLSETGLYTDTAAGTLAPGVMPFQPQFQLWSDSAAKRRWVKLPEGTQINSTVMDFWTFPQGTKFWKEFSRDNVRVETRILWKQGAGAADWYMMAFKWNAEQTDAVATPDGEIDASGTPHDIPTQEDCNTCHRNMRDKAIGFSAIQLAYAAEAGNVTLDQLVAMGLLTVPPAAPIVLPGNDVDKAALGYMQANCGMCHNERANVFAAKLNDLNLWLHAEPVANCGATCGDLASVQTTAPYLGLVNVVNKKGNILGSTVRLTPGNIANSSVYQVMSVRDAVPGMMAPADAGGDGGVLALQMPPLGTEMSDPTGLAAMEAWITQLAQ